VLRALLKIGWTEVRHVGGSHRILSRPGWDNYTWSFPDSEELGSKMMSRIAKKTGLLPGDLSSGIPHGYCLRHGVADS
jgi:predicted RNA binding protein YcfA (HicA-like mRNA interferase family)